MNLAGESFGNWIQTQEDDHKIAKDAMVAAQARQAYYGDRGRVHSDLNVGDMVLV